MRLIPTIAVILTAISIPAIAQVAPTNTPASTNARPAAIRLAAARQRLLARIDQREANQQRRIAAGIKQGQLTPDESAQLQSLETNIHALDTALQSAPKLTRPAVQQIRQALHQASLQIWAHRHDTQGTQKPALRLGKNVVAQDQLTTAIESGTFSKEQARTFLQDFRRLVSLKRRLTTDLPADQRAQLQSEYDALLNEYFLVK
jgi:hypothetical protein